MNEKYILSDDERHCRNCRIRTQLQIPDKNENDDKNDPDGIANGDKN